VEKAQKELENLKLNYEKELKILKDDLKVKEREVRNLRFQARCSQRLSPSPRDRCLLGLAWWMISLKMDYHANCICF
jgi:hypothetical protein